MIGICVGNLQSGNQRVGDGPVSHTAVRRWQQASMLPEVEGYLVSMRRVEHRQLEYGLRSILLSAETASERTDGRCGATQFHG